jgi:hypothetical protein
MKERETSREKIEHYIKRAKNQESLAKYELREFEENPDDKRLMDKAIDYYKGAYDSWKHAGHKKSTRRCLSKLKKLRKSRKKEKWWMDKVSELIEEDNLMKAASLYKTHKRYGKAAELYEKMGKTQEASIAHKMEGRREEKHAKRALLAESEIPVSKDIRVNVYKEVLGKAIKHYKLAGDKKSLERVEELEKRVGRAKKISKAKGLAKYDSVIGIIGAIFFLSPNITGNAIGDISSTTSEWLAAVLLVLGLVGFYCIKK